MQHQRWDSHGRQDVAQVGLLEGTVEGIRHRWACANTEVVREPAPLLLAWKQARTPVAHDLVRHRVGSPAIAEVSEGGDAISVFETVTACSGVEQRQRPGPLRVGRGVQDGHAATFVRGKDHRPGRPCCVQHRVQILHPSFQGGELAAVVGQAGATLVEQDQPETRSQQEVKIPPSRILPRVDDVRHVVGHVDQIGVPLTYDLVGDRDSATARILDLRRRHVRHCLQKQSWRQPADCPPRQELRAVACSSRASVSASAGIAPSRSNSARAWWRTGVASCGRPRVMRQRP
jgi:hypothetical protein